MTAEIRKEKYASKNLGRENINRYGQKMTIVDVFDFSNVTVEFEDGTKVYNKTMYDFNQGKIINPNHKIFTVGCSSIRERSCTYWFDRLGFQTNYEFNGFVFDTYNPELKVAIEYDGALHRTKEEQDKRKDMMCKENGITIIRIREIDKISSDYAITIPIGTSNEFSERMEIAFQKAVNFLHERFGTEQFDVELKKNKTKIIEDFRVNFTYDLVGKYFKDKNGEEVVVTGAKDRFINITYVSDGFSKIVLKQYLEKGNFSRKVRGRNKNKAAA